MLISRQHKKVLLNLRNPALIQAQIPHSKVIDYEGRPILVVPHGVEEAQVLNNMGIKVPSPITYTYDFPGRFKPFFAQRATAALATLHRRMYILNEMGTGKSLAALWAADYLMRQGLIRRAVILCPMSTMERTWGDEVFESFPERTFATVYGSAARRVKMVNQDVDFYILNHHGLKIDAVRNALLSRGDIDLVIVDELAVYRNNRSDMWKSANKFINAKGRPVPWAWGMTGTPMPKAPTDAYAQCKLLTPSTVPAYFGGFRDQVMRQESTYVWVPRDDAIEQVYDVMQPSVRFTRDECVDLPPCLYEERHVELSPEQKAAYQDMLNHLIAEAQEGSISALNEVGKLGKLVQIACGVAYGSDGQAIVLPAKPRIAALKEIIDSATGKVIVYVPFTGALEMLQAELAEWTTARIDGTVSKTNRDDVFYRFQHDPDLRVLVAQPQAMSHGLTLTEANTIVWYAPTNSNDTYQQANHRIIRPGQKQNQFVINLEGSPVERKMYRRLRNQQAVQVSFLEMISGS
jgi:SNF2 family DNA or RNA helicase